VLVASIVDADADADKQQNANCALTVKTIFSRTTVLLFASASIGRVFATITITFHKCDTGDMISRSAPSRL